MPEDWISFSKASGIIRSRLACSEGRAGAVMRQAKASGEVRSVQQPGDDDGLLDFELPITLRVGTLPSPARHFLAHRYSHDDLLDWLDWNHPQKQPAQPKGKGGRPPKFDRGAVAAEVQRLMDHHDEFSPDDPEWNAQARLVEAICEKFGEAAPSTVEDYIKEPLAKWRERKAGRPET